MGINHFKDENGGVLCKSKGKNINLTDNIKDVTCKRCLKKLESVEDIIKPDSEIKFTEHKKLKYCLSINDVFLKIGDNLNDKVTKMILSKDGGIVSTNIRFSGKKVLDILSENDILYLYEWFDKRIMENKSVYVYECKEFFGEK